MTLLSPNTTKAGSNVLRQQFTDLICDASVPIDQLGTLPEAASMPQKRVTLHLSDKLKTTTEKACA